MVMIKLFNPPAVIFYMLFKCHLNPQTIKRIMFTISAPKPWKMPYHLRNKILGTKIALITCLAACVLSFLISILVLITRTPFLKLMLMLTCALGRTLKFFFNVYNEIILHKPASTLFVQMMFFPCVCVLDKTHSF